MRVVKGDRIKIKWEEVRIYIIVVIFVDREMFRDLTGFLLLSFQVDKFIYVSSSVLTGANVLMLVKISIRLDP